MSDMNSPQSDGAMNSNPLRPVFVVWPGRTHSQVWMFLWLAVAFVIGALLPWHGANDVRCLLAEPVTLAGAEPTVDVSMVEYRMGIANHHAFPGQTPAMPALVALRDPGMSVGQVLLLISALAAVAGQIVAIWNRGFALAGILMTELVALAVVNFYRGFRYEAPATDGWAAAPTSVGGLTQLGDTIGGVLGNLGSLFKGTVPAELSRVLERFGPGYYVTIAAMTFFVLFFVFTIVTGMAKKKDPKVGTPPARRPMPPKKDATV